MISGRRRGSGIRWPGCWDRRKWSHGHCRTANHWLECTALLNLQRQVGRRAWKSIDRN